MSAELIERLRKRAEVDRSCATNSQVIVELLKPQMDAFDVRTDYNPYAVRMAVDHQSSIKRDTQYAADLDAAAAALEASSERERKLRFALDDLQQAEAEYRSMHDRHGGDARATGRAWDLMRRCGGRAREALAEHAEAVK